MPDTTHLAPEDLLQRTVQQPAETVDVSFSATPKRAKNQQPRLFLDLFSGVNAPLTHSMHSKGLDHFQPFDLDKDPSCNVLDDSMFALLLRMAWSGLIGAI